MRKIIGYMVVISDPSRGESLAKKVMEEVAKDPRWELAGGPVYCPPPMQRGVFMQALVMYEETDRSVEKKILEHIFGAECTRDAGHTGPCNGFWREQCGAFKALP